VSGKAWPVSGSASIRSRSSRRTTRRRPFASTASRSVSPARSALRRARTAIQVRAGSSGRVPVCSTVWATIVTGCFSITSSRSRADGRASIRPLSPAGSHSVALTPPASATASVVASAGPAASGSSWTERVQVSFASNAGTTGASCWLMVAARNDRRRRQNRMPWAIHWYSHSPPQRTETPVSNSSAVTPATILIATGSRRPSPATIIASCQQTICGTPNQRAARVPPPDLGRDGPVRRDALTAADRPSSTRPALTAVPAGCAPANAPRPIPTAPATPYADPAAAPIAVPTP
jgi:hypothetical protein